MTFEIFESGRRVFYTEHESCVPPDDQLRQMKSSPKYRYTFKRDGKSYTIKKEDKKHGNNTT